LRFLWNAAPVKTLDAVTTTSGWFMDVDTAGD